MQRFCHPIASLPITLILCLSQHWQTATINRICSRLPLSSNLTEYVRRWIPQRHHLLNCFHKVHSLVDYCISMLLQRISICIYRRSSSDDDEIRRGSYIVCSSRIHSCICSPQTVLPSPIAVQCRYADYPPSPFHSNRLLLLHSKSS